MTYVLILAAILSVEGTTAPAPGEGGAPILWWSLPKGGKSLVELGLPVKWSWARAADEVEGGVFSDKEVLNWRVRGRYGSIAAARKGRSGVEKQWKADAWRDLTGPASADPRLFGREGLPVRGVSRRGTDLVFGTPGPLLASGGAFPKGDKGASAALLAQGKLDIQAWFGHLAGFPTASRDASVAVRLGLDECREVEVRVESAGPRQVRFSSRLSYGGRPAGLLDSVGEAVPLSRPAKLPPEVVSYSAFSIKPAEIYSTLLRTAAYLSPLPAELMRAHMRSLASRLDALVDVDIFGEGSELWELLERQTAAGGTSASVRISVHNLSKFREMMGLLDPFVKAVIPELGVRPLKRKAGGWFVGGAAGGVYVGILGSKVVFAPSLAELDGWADAGKWGWTPSKERGVAWGERRSGALPTGVALPGLLGDGGAGVSAIVERFKGVSWLMTSGKGTLLVEGAARVMP